MESVRWVGLISSFWSSFVFSLVLFGPLLCCAVVFVCLFFACVVFLLFTCVVFAEVFVCFTCVVFCRSIRLLFTCVVLRTIRLLLFSECKRVLRSVCLHWQTLKTPFPSRPYPHDGCLHRQR